MENGKAEYKAHYLILPFPIQSHINPVLQFPKTQTLEELIQRLKSSCCPVDCIIYDPFLPWGLDLAKKLGLLGAAFFTQSCAVDHIYYHAYKGDFKLPLSESEILIPGLPPLKPSDMPSFLYVHCSYPPLFDIVVNQFQSIEKADWLLFNTFHKLEEDVIDWMAKSSPVKAIGPTIPSMYLDKRLEDDREYGLSVYKPMTGVCMEWLDKRESESVIYVSFGSMAQLRMEEMEELAWGLKMTNKYFLWVVRSVRRVKTSRRFC
ncbi:UDP-glycosyltransferase 74E2 [Abeliophyllum distichum]|uniref:UDP-glycosyltransferase 74E2 n=1 Tax=Abeliophyllum distichum TaxID=126358 RepID=A0ABD1TXJ2_9LAMI